MRYLQPFALILSLVASACVDSEPQTPRTDEDTVEPARAIGEDIDEASVPESTLALDEDPEPSSTTQPPPPLSFCDIACAGLTAEAAADCSVFAFGGAAACGIATSALCESVCASRSAPRSHCSTVHGGRGCMTTQYMWWCDTAVDGNRVRMQYELKSPFEPGVVKTVWAPSRACHTVRFPNAGNTKRWRVCAENNGCSGWFHP